ncbi:terminase large subunit [Larkinella ripae]
MNVDLAKRYINDVETGKILVCIPVRQAIERHLNDLKTGSERGIWFDEAAATRALKFFSFLRHSKGKWAGRPFELAPWQAFIVYVLFGWKRDDGTRRFRYAYVEVPRKNGKTTFAAGVALYMMIADGESGAEIYTGATTREQAKICFEESQRMVRKSPLLQTKANVLAHNIHVMSTASKMQAVSSDANTLDGLNPHCVILDEIHAYKNRELFDIFDSATGARSQPLIFMITTAGFNKEWFCYKYRRDVLSVLSGAVLDDSLFGIVYTLDETDNWTDPAVWGKANPNYGVSVYESYLRDKVYQATIRPSEQVNVKTKNLNVWTDASKVWIPDEVWMGAAGVVDEMEMAQRRCYGGLDLAATSDFNAWALLFPADDGFFDVLLRCWIPEDTVKKRIDAGLHDLQQWVDEGWVRTTSGNVSDYNQIRDDIVADFSTFGLESAAYDRLYNSSHIVQEIENELGPVYRDGEYKSRMSPFGQGFVSMSAPTKEFERLAMLGKIRHGGNPVLRWMLRNVEIKTDPAGNIKVDKSKSAEKIDGVVAVIEALGEYLTWNWNSEEPSQYEDASNPWF